MRITEFNPGDKITRREPNKFVYMAHNEDLNMNMPVQHPAPIMDFVGDLLVLAGVVNGCINLYRKNGTLISIPLWDESQIDWEEGWDYYEELPFKLPDPDNSLPELKAQYVEEKVGLPTVVFSYLMVGLMWLGVAGAKPLYIIWFACLAITPALFYYAIFQPWKNRKN